MNYLFSVSNDPSKLSGSSQNNAGTSVLALCYGMFTDASELEGKPNEVSLVSKQNLVRFKPLASWVGILHNQKQQRSTSFSIIISFNAHLL